MVIIYTEREVMMMETYGVYSDAEILGFPPPNIPPLYPWAPIGVATADVESLTGYIGRLAQAHHVLVTRLLYKPLTTGGGALLPLSSNRYLMVLNSRADLTRAFVERLKFFSGVPNMALLTCLPFREVLPDKWLFKHVQHWCPQCYHEWADSGAIIYDPLYWMLVPVEICHYHHRPLIKT